MTEQICVCIVSSLSAYILQSTLESMVTPLTKQLLGWGQKENALFFVGVGITAVIGYLTVTVSTKSYQITWYFVIQLRNPFYVTIFVFSFLGDVSSREWHLPLGLLLNSQFLLQWLSFYQLLNFGTHKTRFIKNYTRAVTYFSNSHFLPFLVKT